MILVIVSQTIITYACSGGSMDAYIPIILLTTESKIPPAMTLPN
jgi:hypothetical protein